MLNKTGIKWETITLKRNRTIIDDLVDFDQQRRYTLKNNSKNIKDKRAQIVNV